MAPSVATNVDQPAGDLMLGAKTIAEFINQLFEGQPFTEKRRLELARIWKTPALQARRPDSCQQGEDTAALLCNAGAQEALAAQVRAGTLSANAAAIEAGFSTAIAIKAGAEHLAERFKRTADHIERRYPCQTD